MKGGNLFSVGMSMRLDSVGGYISVCASGCGTAAFSKLIWPTTTPAATKSIAAQKVGVTASPSQKCAQAIVLNGMRLLNRRTRLVGQWRRALFQMPKDSTPPATMQ